MKGIFQIYSLAFICIRDSNGIGLSLYYVSMLVHILFVFTFSKYKLQEMISNNSDSVVLTV